MECEVCEVHYSELAGDICTCCINTLNTPVDGVGQWKDGVYIPD